MRVRQRASGLRLSLAMDASPPHVLVVGTVGAIVFALCTCCIARCFRQCGEEQRRAMRDDEYELTGPWKARVRSFASRTIRKASSSRGAYTRVPVSDHQLFVTLPA